MKRIMHSGKTVVFLDIETTGFDASANQALEIGAVRVENFPNGAQSEFSQLVFASHVPSKIVEITGITAEMVEDAEEEVDVLAQFTEFCEGAEVYVGHNASKFDVNFLEERGAFLGDDYEVFDTLLAARTILPDLEKHTLGHLVDHFKVKVPATHRALDDVKATIEVFSHLAIYEPDADAERLIQLQEEISKLQKEVDSVSFVVFNRMQKDNKRAIMTSRGTAISFTPPKEKSTFKTAKFKKDYKGDASIFEKTTSRFDKDLVNAFDSKLYNSYVETVMEPPKMDTAALVTKKGR